MEKTEQHTVYSPPDALVREWQRESNHNEPMFPQVVAKAAQWGADQELEACCEWVKLHFDGMILWSDGLRTTRRPPPSLKERALNLIPEPGGIGRKVTFTMPELEVIRKALEALPNPND
jgi:hypothetical protein